MVGQHERDYPRNVVNQRLIRAAGYDVVLCHSRRHPILKTGSIVGQYLLRAGGTQLAFCTEGSHRHVPWLKLATLWTGHQLVFDPFISMFNTEVEDRKLHAPWSYMGVRGWMRDFLGCHFADHLVFDTHEHKEYFFSRYRVKDKPFTVLPVGIDEHVFRPLPHPARPHPPRCEVLFYGTYIPLHGIDVILRAAELLRDRADVRITIIGDGQEGPRLRGLAERLALPNLQMLGMLPPSELAERIAAADVCLGIFDSGLKASQVVPNKVVQCAAMGRPIITRRSPAIERYFEHGESAVLVAAADPVALARAIGELAADPARREAIGSAARALFERRFSQAALRQTMQTLLDQAAAQRSPPLLARFTRARGNS